MSKTFVNVTIIVCEYLTYPL